ncbi:MAG: efflux RND transporter periplasmic adaptor subunit [Candidatus Omnitrophica bacterium]|nr:efflux RND transporter periplasmic adaptor subunit [Candidatus Omnitrophota bacterium]
MTKRDLSSVVLATGVVKPQIGAEVRVGARISGKVDRLYANIGDVVKKGQVIAELEKADLEARVQQGAAGLRLAEAKLSALKSLRPVQIKQAEAGVSQWQATVDLNRKDVERAKELFGKNFISRQDLDQAEAQIAVSESQLLSARKALELAIAGYEEDTKQAAAEVEGAKSALTDARVQLSYATITAPIDGVIGSVSTQQGETVAAGLNAPTFVTIINLARLQVDAFVDEVDIGKVKPGQKAVFTVDSFPSREFAGKVAAIYPEAVIQENVVNYDAVVQITDKYSGLLRPEMTASVSVFLETHRNVLTVPVGAVKRDQGKNIVYVLNNGQLQKREIKVGWKDSQGVEILSGLNEGETVSLKPPEMQPKEP